MDWCWHRNNFMSHSYNLAEHAIWLYCNGIKLSSHIYTYFVIMWLFSDNARSLYKKILYSKVAGFIVETGRLSFFIYLTHCLIIFTFSIIHIPNLWSVRWPLCIVLSYFFARLCETRCPMGMKKYIGF